MPYLIELESGERNDRPVWTDDVGEASELALMALGVKLVYITKERAEEVERSLDRGRTGLYPSMLEPQEPHGMPNHVEEDSGKP